MDITQPRFNLDAFRRYEPFFLQFVSQYPKPLQINPAPLATETFACRCRDSAKAYIFADWPSDLNHSRFIELWSESQVIIRDSYIFIGNKHALREMDSATADSLVGDIVEAGASVDLSQQTEILRSQILHAIATLLTHGILQQMTISGLTYDQAHEHIGDSKYDIEILPTTNNKLLLI